MLLEMAPEKLMDLDAGQTTVEDGIKKSGVKVIRPGLEPRTACETIIVKQM